MTGAPEFLVTREGLEKMQAELDHLVDEWRPAIAERIKAARELGDLKENAEYHDAKNEQGLTELKIRQLEDRIRNARVVEAQSTDVAGIGNAVTVTDESTGDKETWHITGADEADPLEYKVSHESPIGGALMGAKVGQVVKAVTPRGELRLRVDAIDVS